MSEWQGTLQSIQRQVRRKEAFDAKGWTDPFELIDDILKRGIDAVKTDRDIVEATNPK